MKIAVILACGTLASCAAGNTGAKFSASHNTLTLPALVAAPPPAIALPRACPPDLLAAPLQEPVLSNDAFFPAPETDAASAPTARYFAYLHAYAWWAREGWRLAALARAACQ